MSGFRNYMQLRESEDKKTPSGKFTLGDNNSFQPLMVSDDPKSEHYGKNKNLAPIIRAFKSGANWGWSRDDKKGEDKPVKIGGKKLYLMGGAVRDLLKNKTPKKMELKTNASPDEIFKILTQNDFEFADKAKGKKSFWILKKNGTGRPTAFGLRVNDQDFTLAPFTKNPKGIDGEDELGTHFDDANSRDFKINALSLGLTNDNGANKELTDFFGGMNDISSGSVNAIGNLKDKLKEDPVRALRFVRLLSRYGDGKISPETKETIKKCVSGAKTCPKRVLDEFIDGLSLDDIDRRKFLKAYKDLGLTDMVFPGLKANTSFPKEMTGLNDKFMPLSYMLSGQDPSKVKSVLDKGGWKPEDVAKITFLAKSLGGMDDLDSLDDMLANFNQSGVSGNKFAKWMTKIGKKDEDSVNSFIKLAQKHA